MAPLHSNTENTHDCGGTAWSGRASFETIYDAYRSGLLTWDGIQASQEQHSYRPCDNGCLLPGKFRTLDNRELCGPCYADIALDEQRKVFGQ